MSRPPLFRLPPWSRAPWLGLRQPAAVVAVIVTSAILACALASAPLFLSSARSAALQEQLAPLCAEAGWPGIGGFAGLGAQATPDGVAAFAARYRQAWTERGYQSDPALITGTSIGPAGNPQAGIPVRGPGGATLTQPATLFWRPEATARVDVVASIDGAGVWLPASYAEDAGAAVGDQLAVAEQPVTVTGIYTDLYQTDAGRYWCDYGDLYLNLASANSPPPALVLAADEQTFYDLAAVAGFIDVRELVVTEPSSLSVTVARELLTDQERAGAAASRSDEVPPQATDRLTRAVDRAELIERGLRGPVVPVSVAGALLALVLVGSAGSFWADRRAAEVRLLAARGVGPVPLAGKAALELALPAALGAAGGWAGARLLIAALGPADDLDPTASAQAAMAGTAAFIAGLVCAATVAGLRAGGATEGPLGAAPRWPARVPWELALLAAAGWCALLLEGRHPVISRAGVAQVNGLLVAFPLLGLAGAAVLVTRGLPWLLPALRRAADRGGPAVFLAVNRLAAARLATATLLVAVTLPVAVLGYTATLAGSAQTTLAAKVGVQVGAARALISIPRVLATAGTDRLGTVLDRYDGSVAARVGENADSRGRRGVQVLAIDPATFAGTAFWDDSFADRPLVELVAALNGPLVDGRVPVVAAGLQPGAPDLRLGSAPLAAQVVATARVLPGRRTADPVVLVAADRVPQVERGAGAGRTTELWTNGPVGPATEALIAAGGQLNRVVEPATVLTTANFLGITWTFGYLSALAVFVGVVAVGGLLLYLEARSRTRVSAYVMARRMGLTRAAHLRSLLVELLGVAVAGLVLGALLAAAAVAVVYRRLDVDLVRPPTPLLDLPWTAVGLSVGLTVLVAGLAAGYAQRAADRADPATVLREQA